jgi:hypothetical protein
MVHDELVALFLGIDRPHDDPLVRRGRLMPLLATDLAGATAEAFIQINQ